MDPFDVTPARCVNGDVDRHQARVDNSTPRLCGQSSARLRPQSGNTSLVITIVIARKAVSWRLDDDSSSPLIKRLSAYIVVSEYAKSEGASGVVLRGR